MINIPRINFQLNNIRDSFFPFSQGLINVQNTWIAFDGREFHLTEVSGGGLKILREKGQGLLAVGS